MRQQLVFGTGNILIGGGRGRIVVESGDVQTAYYVTLNHVRERNQVGDTIRLRDAMDLKESSRQSVDLVFLNPESISALRLQLETLEDYFIQQRNHEQREPN